jgi:hypothetical protein
MLWSRYVHTAVAVVHYCSSKKQEARRDKNTRTKGAQQQQARSFKTKA